MWAEPPATEGQLAPGCQGPRLGPTPGAGGAPGQVSAPSGRGLPGGRRPVPPGGHPVPGQGGCALWGHRRGSQAPPTPSNNVRTFGRGRQAGADAVQGRGLPGLPQGEPPAAWSRASSPLLPPRVLPGEKVPLTPLQAPDPPASLGGCPPAPAWALPGPPDPGSPSLPGMLWVGLSHRSLRLQGPAMGAHGGIPGAGTGRLVPWHTESGPAFPRLVVVLVQGEAGGRTEPARGSQSSGGPQPPPSWHPELFPLFSVPELTSVHGCIFPESSLTCPCFRGRGDSFTHSHVWLISYSGSHCPRAGTGLTTGQGITRRWGATEEGEAGRGCSPFGHRLTWPGPRPPDPRAVYLDPATPRHPPRPRHPGAWGRPPGPGSGWCGHFLGES